MGQGLKQALPGRIQNGGIYRIHKDNETITENRAGLLPPFDTASLVFRRSLAPLNL